MVRCVVVDVGVGNVVSVTSALQRSGAIDVGVARDSNEVRRADRIVLPGVGAFSHFMTRLAETGLDEALIDVARLGRPILGICVGHQVLATEGFEFGAAKGLDLLPASCVSLRSLGAAGPVPHVGWNRVYAVGESRTIGSAVSGRSAYFCHSFALHCSDRLQSLVVDCGVPIVAGVVRDNVVGVQFHPEKSQKMGTDFLRAWLST